MRNPNVVDDENAQSQMFLAAFGQNDAYEPIPYDLGDGDGSLDGPFTMEELNRAVSSTRATTPGADRLSINLLKQLNTESSVILLRKLNEMFNAGTVPDSWKLSTIVPVRKPGKPAELITSYRPIALTSVCAKVFERMLLQRLAPWAGRHNIFQSSHFGFQPFRDCTAALCTLFADIHRARQERKYVIAVCLDIKAAYDSVWIDGLIYKMASVGIRGKAGLWIANFVTNRTIQVKWKSTITHKAPCMRGVPQGSVLSPFLFSIYMRDVFEVEDHGVTVQAFADDIIIYAIGSDEKHTRDKMNDTIRRLSTWCNAGKLSLAPEKCTAINFSRRRDPGPCPKVLGHDIPWCQGAKILGVWFTPNLTFSQHFTYLRAKAFKRLNYIKAVAGRSRGVSSFHMLRITNMLVRSLLDYACPLFLNSCPSALKSLEVTYHSAIRAATGLPKWTPIPVLRRETGSSSMASRSAYLTKVFLIKQLSLPPNYAFSDRLRDSLNSPDQPYAAWTASTQEVLQLYNVNPSAIIKFIWISYPYRHDKVRIITEGLPFQATDLPVDSIKNAWHCWIDSIHPNALIATDASKDSTKTAIAAYEEFSKRSVATLIPDINSIFTAEALALCLAIKSFTSNGDNVIISDSLSALRALETINIRSPRVIWQLNHMLQSVIPTTGSITLIWSPGHRGIGPNEEADTLARQGPYTLSTLTLVSPEDLCARIRADGRQEAENAWVDSDYYNDFAYLTGDRRYSHWATSRWDDVAVARWRTKTVLTNARLHRMGLNRSPLCDLCQEHETAHHILCVCSKYSSERSKLVSSLGLPRGASYPTIMESAVSSRRSLAAFTQFISAAHCS